MRNTQAILLPPSNSLLRFLLIARHFPEKIKVDINFNYYAKGWPSKIPFSFPLNALLCSCLFLAEVL